MSPGPRPDGLSGLRVANQPTQPSASPSLEEQKALAELYFPQQWAWATYLTGEKGRKARKTWRDRAVNEHRMIPLRAAGRSCEGCKHRGRIPSTKRPCCDLTSDYRGYTVIALTDLCADWAAR